MADDDLFVTHNQASGATRSVERVAALRSLPSDTVDTDAIEDGAVDPTKRSGGFYQVQFNFGSGTGSISITGVPFRPKALITFGAYSSGSVHKHSLGMAVDGSPIVQAGQGGSSGASSGSNSSTTGPFKTISGTGTLLFSANITAWNSDGITVDKTTGSSTAAETTYNILFLG